MEKQRILIRNRDGKLGNKMLSGQNGAESGVASGPASLKPFNALTESAAGGGGGLREN